MFDPARHQLLDLFKTTGAYKTGSFTLASGRVSNHYFDCKSITLHPTGIFHITDWMAQQVRKAKGQLIGGLEAAAIPLVTALILDAATSYDWMGNDLDSELHGFYVRKEPKAHGEQKLIEGHVIPTARTVIVDDVLTSGGSILKAIRAAEAVGLDIVSILVVVDREEERDPAFVKYESLLKSMLKLRDFGE